MGCGGEGCVVVGWCGFGMEWGGDGWNGVGWVGVDSKWLG